MRRRRRWYPTALAVVIFMLSVPLAFAVNAGSAATHWPGWLDIVRGHPFWAAAALMVASVVVLILLGLRDNSGPEPASTEDLLDAEQRLHRRFDEADVARAGIDERVERLPPYPRALILASGVDSATIWKVVAPFTDDAINPHVLAREWAASAPAVLEELPAAGRLAVGEILLAYGQAEAAIEQLQAAVRLGATPRAYWIVRTAQVAWQCDGDDSARINDLLAEAESVDADYPLLRAIRLVRSGTGDLAAECLAGWRPHTPWEQDTCRMVHAAAVLEQRLDEAISVMESGIQDTSNAGLLLQLAGMLRVRSVQGGGDSRWQDALRAVDLALRARNLRRSWRGDSAEAVVAAAEAAIIADDHQQVWSITRPAPDGEATPGEAADARVLPVAAMGAALTGRVAQARELVSYAPEGFARMRVEAEIASAVPTHGSSTTATVAWMDALNTATDDDQKLHALRGLAFEGVTDQSILDDLRSRHPLMVADIESIVGIVSVSGPDADERLHELESRTPTASVRRAELLRLTDPQRAADVLADAAARWNDARLLLLAIDCCVDAADWDRADALAQQAISDVGALWPGRATVLRRIVAIQNALQNWPKMAAACRNLLEIDARDQAARWNLALAEYRAGDLEEAWRTLNRARVSVDAATPHHAMLLLDLVRRYGDAVRVAQTALTVLRTFPDDQHVHAAAIHAVTTRTDQSDLPDDIGPQVTAAWSSFLQRYPQSEAMTAFTVRDDNNPLADIEPQLRQQAATYQEVLDTIRDKTVPIGMLERVVGKPYAAVFLYRPLGYHPAASSAEQDIVVELNMARAATATTCFVDASALYTLALIPEYAQTLISLTHRPALTDASLHDLIAADDLVSIPSVGTLGFDSESGRVVAVEHDPDAVRLQQHWIRSMLATARGLRRVTHPALVHLTSISKHRDPVWLLNLDAAKDSDGVLWADDLGLRRLAHSLGIKTFGTLSLLSVARERQRIDDIQVDEITRVLIREYVVDLPFDQAALLSVAAEQDWEPRAVAVVLSRPVTWVDFHAAFRLFRTAFRSARGETLAGWAYAALHGLNAATSPIHRHNNFVSLVAATIVDAWTRPEHASAIVAALRTLAPDQTDTIVRVALDRVWAHMKETFAPEEAVIVFLHVISRLDEDHRQHAVALILHREE